MRSVGASSREIRRLRIVARARQVPTKPRRFGRRPPPATLPRRTSQPASSSMSRCIPPVCGRWKTFRSVSSGSGAASQGAKVRPGRKMSVAENCPEPLRFPVPIASRPALTARFRLVLPPVTSPELIDLVCAFWRAPSSRVQIADQLSPGERAFEVGDHQLRRTRLDRYGLDYRELSTSRVRCLHRFVELSTRWGSFPPCRCAAQDPAYGLRLWPRPLRVSVGQ